MSTILNCLPPADVNNPNISLSILRKFMENNGVTTSVKYWNFSLSVMDDFIETEDTEIKVLPFLSILNDRAKNEKGNQHIVELLKKIDPSDEDRDSDYYSSFLQQKKDAITKVLQVEIAKIDFSSIELFGISAKYNQWVPGLVLAQEIKKTAPHVKIVVGGFGSKNVAKEALKHAPHFDFCTWGEGEYPLLELYTQITSENPNYAEVPRLFYRDNDELVLSLNKKSEYLDFENYIFPDYDDYIDTFPDTGDQELINIPINTTRSCSWCKCKFCDFNVGYKLRIRSPQCIVNEIETLTNKHGFITYTFVDSDTFGTAEHFEELLDLLIALKLKNQEDYVFWAEIIPNNAFNERIMRKMVVAGFKNIFIGYDALCDSLLSKMNKKNSFSDNIFFIKQCIKQGISPLVNVIKHIPDETKEEVKESMNNLNFLRFNYNDPIVSFSHNYVNLLLSSMAQYYKSMAPEKRQQYDVDSYADLMPDSFTNDEEGRFHLFRYANNTPINKKEWDNLEKAEDYYKDNNFNYKTQEVDGILYYTEYCNDEEICNLVFEELEFKEVIKACQEQVIQFNDLLKQVNISPERLKEVLTILKDTGLVYYGKAFENIIAVIEV